MKVSELMTRNVQSCTPETNLSTAAMQMWDGDFGTLPVLDGDGKVVGMITDRDICIAAATRHQDIATINVGEVINGQVQSCTPDMSISDTLKVLEKAQVRRLPVVDKDQKLQGILSINDIVHYTGDVKKSSGVSHADVVNSLKSI
ncbi:MAG: CBS domain-containing protein, partial [Blastocatellia bacterium]